MACILVQVMIYRRLRIGRDGPYSRTSHDRLWTGRDGPAGLLGLLFRIFRYPTVASRINLLSLGCSDIEYRGYDWFQSRPRLALLTTTLPL